MSQIFPPSANSYARGSIVALVVLVATLGPDARPAQPVALHDARPDRPRAAGAVQPPAPRRRPRHRLPLLSHHGREGGLGGHSADQDLHELPLADLEHQPDISSRCAAASATTSRCAGSRVHDLPDFVYFNHSVHVKQGRRLRDLSRPRGPDAADATRRTRCRWSGASTATATRRSTCGRARQVFQMDYAAAGQPDRARPPAGEGIRHSVADVLLDVSPVRRCDTTHRSRTAQLTLT